MMVKRVLLDENLTHKLRFVLTGHTVITSWYQGWGGRSNGELITLAEASFDVLITADQNLSYQQNLKGRNLALVVLSTNEELIVLAGTPRILSVLNAAEPSSYTYAAEPSSYTFVDLSGL